MPALFRKILVPYDFSKSAARALDVAADLAARHDGSLLVMHAISPIYPPHGLPILPSAAEVAAVKERLAEDVARAVAGRRVGRVRSRVMTGAPASCILEAARKADAIVMGTLGRSGLPHLLLGSVAERVIRHAEVPVLTVRAGARSRHRSARR
ncbi:MAG: universal stress protein [Deltaproteobacteria bacterium]|nr:universal stress protein [Deltaproteobacteria bacterium]